jgi:hypothetical protein
MTRLAAADAANGAGAVRGIGRQPLLAYLLYLFPGFCSRHLHLGPVLIEPAMHSCALGLGGSQLWLWHGLGSSPSSGGGVLSLGQRTPREPLLRSRPGCRRLKGVQITQQCRDAGHHGLYLALQTTLYCVNSNKAGPKPQGHPSKKNDIENRHVTWGTRHHRARHVSAQHVQAHGASSVRPCFWETRQQGCAVAQRGAGLRAAWAVQGV